jgi:Chemoreceptor zinc-binding domain
VIKIEMIENAITAHAGWKARLRAAVISGKFDGTSATVKVDNQCDFGKWLYSAEFSDSDRDTDHYRTVKQLHAQFHEEAAKVVELAISDQKSVAEKAIGVGGPYAKISTALTEAMIKWRQSLR